MDKIQVAKTITKFVASSSVGLVVTKAIAANVPIVNQREKIQMIIGATVIGGMVKDKAGEWTDTKFDELILAIKKAAQVIEEQEDEEIAEFQEL